MSYQPTTTDLKAAYRRAGLWRRGISYAKAIASPLIRWSLTHSAIAAAQRQAAAGAGFPQQHSLI